MNKQRRKEIKLIADKLDTLTDMLQDIVNDEQAYYDNIPENLQNSERALSSEESIYTLEEIINNLNEAVGDLEEVGE